MISIGEASVVPVGIEPLYGRKVPMEFHILGEEMKLSRTESIRGARKTVPVSSREEAFVHVMFCDLC